jgi:hypothetical protein|tara:strand:- start:4116 stop:4769 length:654 start_codon:yes stop_codon:yes gene_type:complete
MGIVEPSGHGSQNQFFDMGVTRQGAQIVQDQILYWALQGRLFHAQQGDAITQLAWTETTYDEDQPQFALNVPTGKTVIPVSLVFNIEDQAGTDNHWVWSSCTNDIGTGTSTSLTISNMRTDAPHASGCAANSLYTGNATAATGLIEIIRWVDPFVAAAGTMAGGSGRLEWDIRSSSAIPVLVGPATLQAHIYATGTDAEGFGEYVWAEFDTPALVTK